MLSALSDLRLVLRRLRGRPAASAAAVATLAVGIGGAVAIFSLWDALLLRPLGFREPDRLVEIEERDGVDGRDLPGWATFEDWRTRSHSVSAMAATSLWMPTLTGGEAERLVGFRVGPGYFDMLGVEPVVGRVFLPEEDVRGRHRVVVLADGLWRRHFGGDRSIVGRAISIEGIDFLVVGVLPRGFEPPVVPGSTPSTPEIFTPLAYNSSLGWACRTCHHLHVIGRLAPGATLASAAADLDAIGKSLARAYPKEYNGGGAFVTPLRESLFGSARPLLNGLIAAVVLLLLIATANLASMQLAAAIPRRHELAVRGALGARRRDLAKLLLTENAALGLAGAIAGAAVARGLLGVAFKFAPANLDRLRAASIDARALAVAIALGLVSALLFGALPAWSARRDAARLLASARGAVSDRGRRRALAALVAIDVALGVVLLAGAALLGGSLQQLLAQRPGFRDRDLLTMGLTLGGKRENASIFSLYERLIARVRGLPGVVDAGLASQLPLSGSFDGVSVHPEKGGASNPELDPGADRYAVSASYLSTLGVPLVAGRMLEESDRAGAARAVVISQALAKRLWPNESPLGMRLRVADTDGPWSTVVGVVGDVRHRSLEATSPGAVYLPLSQWRDPDTDVALVVRAERNATALAKSLRATVRELDAATAIGETATMETLIAESTATRRFAALLVGGFAAIALLLAALGVQGVVAYSVGERRRELGLRRALGATGAALMRTLYGRLFVVAGAGAAIGIAGALVFGRALEAQLYQVRASDPSVLAAVALALLVVAAAAAIGPARRALSVDPSEALREE